MEILAIASGAAGLASLAVQISTGAARLRDSYRESKKIPQDVKTTLEDLDFLVLLMPVLDEIMTNNSHEAPLIVGHCTKAIEVLASELDNVTTRIPVCLTDESVTKKAAVARAFYLRGLKSDVERLKRLAMKAKMDLNLALGYSHIRSIRNITESGSVSTRGPLTEAAGMDADSGNTALRRLQSRTICTVKSCSCRCHTQAAVESRFWSFQYTPLSMILGHCDNPNCSGRRHQLGFRVAFSQFGIPWAAMLGFCLSVESGRYSLMPVLQIEHVVRYTSPGFKLLAEIKEGIVSWPEGRRRFVDMFREDQYMKDHVNPAGRSYIEELVRCPVPGYELGPVLELLGLFMKDFKWTRGLGEINLLYRCARWIGEAPHLLILEELLALGFDPGRLASPLAREWPNPCSPDWQSEERTEDPFFIEYIAKMIAVDPDFRGTSYLQRNILCGIKPSQAICENADATQDRNFLGQSALHLATWKGDYIPALIESGHDVNATDVYGITPLMYAAAMGRVDAGKELISGGADFTRFDQLRHRDFLLYALGRGHYSVALELTLHLQSTYPEGAAFVGSYYAQSIIIELVASHTYAANQQSKDFFSRVIGLLENPNFTFSDRQESTDGNTIMHYRGGLHYAKAAIAAGFSALNHQNSEGLTPLMIAARSFESGQVQYCLDQGANIKVQDRLGKTPLAHALEAWSHSGSPLEVALSENICILLQAGADAGPRDVCVCPCSPGGCLPIAALGAYFAQPGQWSSLDLTYAVEWLVLLEECELTSLVKASLLSFIRRARFDEMGMTHICCHHGKSGDSSFLGFLAPESLSGEARDNIKAEQKDTSDALDLEMTELENIGVAELQVRWLQQLRRSHDAYLARHNYSDWEALLRRAGSIETSKVEPIVHELRVNFQEDRLEMPWRDVRMDTKAEKQKAMYTPLSDIVSYVWSLEKRLHGRRLSNDPNSPDPAIWYTPRLTWVRQLADRMAISVDLIVAELHRYRIKRSEALEKEVVEALISHFMVSFVDIGHCS